MEKSSTTNYMMHMKNLIRTTFLICLLHLICTCSHAQESWLQMHGSFGASSDYFSQNNSTLPALDPVHRASINISLNLFNKIELPFSAYITNRGGAGYSQPFNQFGINPKFGNWLQLHGGYFSKQYSEFTLGDTRLLGGGIDLTLKNFQISGIYGYSLLARQGDSTQNFGGTYARRMVGGRLGYSSDKSTFGINILHGWDDPTSIAPIRFTTLPFENLVTSLSFSTPIIDEILNVDGEAGISMFTANTSAILVDSSNRINELESIVGYNSSTSMDVAFRLGMGVNISENFSIRGNAKWVGPGFVSLGYTQMLNDMIELTVSPSLRLLDNAISLNGSIGSRTNNLRNMKTGTTSQLIGSVSANIQFTQQIGLDASYSNFGIRSTVQNDTLRISNISQFYSLTPHVNFQMFDGANTVAISLLHQSTNDQNQFNPNPQNNENTTVSAMHSIAFPSSLSFTTVAMKNNGKSSGITNTEISITNFNETVGYSIFEKTLALSASLGMNFIKVGTETSQFFARFTASYTAGAWGNLGLSVMNNSYDYSATGALSYSEFQGSLQYGVSF